MNGASAVSKGLACSGSEFHWGERTYVMGVINLTPDSFSGDGLVGHTEEALNRAMEFELGGADIIDVGAHSTRPGHMILSDDEELSRLLPVLNTIVSRVKVPVSVDTYKSSIAKEALGVGVSIINDVWGLKADDKIAEVAAEFRVPVILMHNQPTTEYNDLVADVLESLKASVDQALQAGVSHDNIIIDPGIGFGKTADHNLEILRRLREFRVLGFPLLVGTSRKSTIGLVLDQPVDQRLEGTAATVALSVAGGADIVRVHDVKEMVRVVKMSDAIIRSWRPEGWKK